VYLPVVNIPRCINFNVKILGLQDLQLPGMAAISRPPVRARTVYHRTQELLIKQHTATSLIKEGAKHAQSSSRSSSCLVDVRQPDQLFIKDHPNVPCGISFPKNRRIQSPSISGLDRRLLTKGSS
jgi:hypothetical protein